MQQTCTYLNQSVIIFMISPLTIKIRTTDNRVTLTAGSCRDVAAGTRAQLIFRQLILPSYTEVRACCCGGFPPSLVFSAILKEVANQIMEK